MEWLFDLFKINIFSHRVLRRRLRLFWLRLVRLALLGILLPEWTGGILLVALHISELFTDLAGSPGDGETKIKDKFI